MPGLRVHAARFRGGNEPCVHRLDRPVGGSFCAAGCRVVCAHSLPQETSAGRNLITLFRTVNICAHFFFRQVGVASRPSSMAAARRTTTTTVATLPHRRDAFRKQLYLRGLRKRVEVRTCSMPRSHRCIAVATGGRRGCVRLQKKTFRDTLVSRRTIPICAKVRELQRHLDGTATTVGRASRTSHRACRRTFAMHSTRLTDRPARHRAHPDDGVRTRAANVSDIALRRRRGTAVDRSRRRRSPDRHLSQRGGQGAKTKPAAHGGRS